ncbi:AMP-binding protein, partial [Sphingobium sp.]|uniref:AMP-binding protein n=1 Tax=Sphingobium sp. TaxID=1912891 RepID=UPI002E1C4CE0
MIDVGDRPASFNFTRDVVGHWASVRPDAPAMVWTDPTGTVIRRSFADMAAAAARAAAVLADVGVGRGDTVLILLNREIEWWELMLGCIAIGAIASPGTTQLMAKDIAYRYEAAAARCVVASGDMAGRVEAALVDCDVARLHIGGARDGWGDYSTLRATVTPIAETADTGFDEDALCYFTSGTTGQPKMTIHSHGYTLAHRITGSYWLDLKPDDLHWNLSDTGWAKAAWSSLFAPWLMGAAIFVYHAPSFDPVATLDLLETMPVTTLCAAPTAYRMFVRSDLSGRRFRSESASLFSWMVWMVIFHS